MTKKVNWKYDVLDMLMAIGAIENLLTIRFEDVDDEPELTKVNLTPDQVDEITWKFRGIVEEYLNPNLKDQLKKFVETYKD